MIPISSHVVVISPTPSSYFSQASSEPMTVRASTASSSIPTSVTRIKESITQPRTSMRSMHSTRLEPSVEYSILAAMNASSFRQFEPCTRKPNLELDEEKINKVGVSSCVAVDATGEMYRGYEAQTGCCDQDQAQTDQIGTS